MCELPIKAMLHQYYHQFIHNGFYGKPIEIQHFWKNVSKLGSIGFKNSKSELTPPVRESLKNSNASKLDQKFSSNTKTCQQ